MVVTRHTRTWWEVDECGLDVEIDQHGNLLFDGESITVVQAWGLIEALREAIHEVSAGHVVSA